MTIDHYATLGIERTATADEIKAAWRRKSSAAHPDREGGCVAAQQAVNQAYECLSDPVRRKAYDETGTDGGGPPIEDEARDMLVQLFLGAIERSTGNWVQEVGQMVSRHAQEVKQQENNAKAKRARLINGRRKVKVKSGSENLVHGLIDAQLLQVDGQLKGFERAALVNAKAASMLKAYEFMDTDLIETSYAGILGSSLFGRLGA